MAGRGVSLGSAAALLSASLLTSQVPTSAMAAAAAG